MEFQTGDVISVKSASNKPDDIFDDKALSKQNMWTSNPVKKIKVREEKTLKLSAIEQPSSFKSNTQRRKEAFAFKLKYNKMLQKRKNEE